MDCCEIRRLLPHRYPFLLVDRIASMNVGTQCIGEKNVTQNEPCFNNIVHFADKDALRYPVALQLESFAQVGALLVLLLASIVVAPVITRDWYRRRVVLPASLAIATIAIYWTIVRIAA